MHNSNFNATTLFQWTINPVVYQNSTVIASSAVLFSLLAGFVTTTRLRKQILMRKISHRCIYCAKPKNVLFESNFLGERKKKGQ